MARPNTICNTGRKIGLAMHLARANTGIKSLQKTAPPAVPLAIQNEWDQESGARRTPQVFVNGLAGAAGGDRAEIEQTIKTAKGVDGALTVPMRLSETGGHFMVEAAGGSGGPAGVFVRRVSRASTVQILRGENAGRSVTYTNVVRAINKLGDWSGQTATFDMPGTARDGEGFVVLMQNGTLERPGAIIAAAKTEGL